MDIVISQKSQRPIYEQIYFQVAAQILSGQLAPDNPLPSIRSTARELGISVITVKSAWDALEKNGFIYTVGGKGCFVSRLKGGPDQKKFLLAKAKLEQDLEYYKSLHLTREELTELIKALY